MNYRRPGALGLTRVRLTRRRRRVLLALLTGADNLHGWRLCQAAQVGSGTLYLFLTHLEKAGWVTRELRIISGQWLHCYSLTEAGRWSALAELRLTAPS